MCGIPVVARRDAALEPMVRDGFNGFLVDEDELAVERISFLLENDDRRNEMSGNSVTHSRRFTIDHCSENVDKLYQHLVQTGSLQK